MQKSVEEHSGFFSSSFAHLLVLIIGLQTASKHWGIGQEARDESNSDSEARKFLNSELILKFFFPNLCFFEEFVANR